jgi:Ribbon-helix-helix protein, copG family
MSTHGIRVDRVTLTVSPEQQEWLNDLANRRGISVSDILRRLIDETRGAYITPATARVDFTTSREPDNNGA